MSSQQPPRPPRRYRTRFFVVPVGLLVFGAIYLWHLYASTRTVTGDFLDPSVLARAVAQGAQRNGDGTPFAEGCRPRPSSWTTRARSTSTAALSATTP